MTFFLLPAGPVQAQTPPQCTPSTCTLTLASVSQVVNGCGDHATPGKMRLTLSSTADGATRQSFNINIGLITSTNDFNSTFNDWEWRSPAIGGNAWRNPDGTGARNINFAGGKFGENIIEVRPKAGAHIWTNRNPSNPNQGPGEMVIPVFSPPSNNNQWTEAGTAYFLFMGGKGCARVNEGGEKVGGIQ